MKILKFEAAETTKKLYAHAIQVEADFHASEELYVDKEDADVEYEVVQDGMSIDSVNKDADYIVDQMSDEISYIKFTSINVKECDFVDASDGDTGYIKFEIKFEADNKITDDNDLQFIAEIFLDDFSDNAEGNVQGTAVYSVDDFDPFSSYGHTEHIETDTINEDITFSYDYKSVKTKLLSVE